MHKDISIKHTRANKQTNKQINIIMLLSPSRGSRKRIYI